MDRFKNSLYITISPTESSPKHNENISITSKGRIKQSQIFNNMLSGMLIMMFLLWIFNFLLGLMSLS